MWKDKLKEIIYILENSNVNEIEVSFWGRKYRVAKEPGVLLQENISSPEKISKQVNDHHKVKNVEEESDLDITDNDNYEELLSPMPGTFYSAPTPDDSPFVSKGEKVKKGQTLCIIEAMKIMNEIESEYDGTISDIKVTNGQAVEYNQVLFVINPT